MRGADARARQHRHGRLGDHRHVDHDPVARLDAEVGQRVRGALDLVEHFGVGDGAGVPGLAFEVDRHPLAQAGLDVAVEAVGGDVQLASGEPLGERRVRPVEGLLPVLGPVEPAGLRLPEREPIRGGLVVGGLRDIRRSGELRGGRERAVLRQEVGERLLRGFCHGYSLLTARYCEAGLLSVTLPRNPLLTTGDVPGVVEREASVRRAVDERRDRRRGAVRPVRAPL